jgi:hypothetical protein
LESNWVSFTEDNGAGIRPQTGNGLNFEHLKFGKHLPDDEEGLGQFDFVYDRIRAVFVLFGQQFLEGRVCVGRMLLMVPSKVSKSSFFSWSMLERSPFPRPNFLKMATSQSYPHLYLPCLLLWYKAIDVDHAGGQERGE